MGISVAVCFYLCNNDIVKCEKESEMSFQDYLKANYTQQEIAAMSQEGLASRRVMFEQAEKRKGRAGLHPNRIFTITGYQPK